MARRKFSKKNVISRSSRNVESSSESTGTLLNLMSRKKVKQNYLLEIKKLQRSTHLLLRKAPFLRVVHEICMELTGGKPLRFQKCAIDALQEASEAYLIHLLELSYLISLHSKRKTLMVQDIQLCRRIRGDFLHDMAFVPFIKDS